MPALVTPQQASQSPTDSSSARVVPKLRVSCWRRPAVVSLGTRMVTSTPALAMSRPATRSQTAAHLRRLTSSAPTIGGRLRPRPFAGARASGKSGPRARSTIKQRWRQAPGVRLIYGVRPAKSTRRQRTAAATASQPIRARAATPAGQRLQMWARQRPAQPGPRGAAGQLPRFSRRSGVTPGHHDSFVVSERAAASGSAARSSARAARDRRRSARIRSTISCWSATTGRSPAMRVATSATECASVASVLRPWPRRQTPAPGLTASAARPRPAHRRRAAGWRGAGRCPGSPRSPRSAPASAWPLPASTGTRRCRWRISRRQAQPHRQPSPRSWQTAYADPSRSPLCSSHPPALDGTDCLSQEGTATSSAGKPLSSLSPLTTAPGPRRPCESHTSTVGSRFASHEPGT